MATRLTAVQGPDSVTTYYNYASTAYGQAVSTIDGRGNTSVREYWADRVVRSTDALGHTSYFLWPQFMGAAGEGLPFYGPVAVTDATGRTSYFRYDSYGHQIDHLVAGLEAQGGHRRLVGARARGVRVHVAAAQVGGELILQQGHGTAVGPPPELLRLDDLADQLPLLAADVDVLVAHPGPPGRVSAVAAALRRG